MRLHFFSCKIYTHIHKYFTATLYNLIFISINLYCTPASFLYNIFCASSSLLKMSVFGDGEYTLCYSVKKSADITQYFSFVKIKKVKEEAHRVQSTFSLQRLDLAKRQSVHLVERNKSGWWFFSGMRQPSSRQITCPREMIKLTREGFYIMLVECVGKKERSKSTKLV